jgi:hypothetical protein
VASRGPAHSSDAAVALTPTPEPPVFIDPRLEVHSQELFAQYVRLTRDATVFLELDRGYHFDGAVFCHLPFRGLPDLFVLLREQPGWRLAYVDSIAAVFVRDRSDGRPAPDPAVVADVPPPPTESLPDLRARYLRGLSLAPWRPLPLAEVYPEIGWGHVQLYLGKREEALAVLLDAALRAPQIGDMHLFVAYVALRLGDRQLFERASGYLQAVQPRHPELGKLHLLARKLWPKPG